MSLLRPEPELVLCSPSAPTPTLSSASLRQHPETANGTVFISIENETGVVQVICWKSLRDAQRKGLLRSRLLLVHGTSQREGDVKNPIAGKLEDLTPMLGRPMTESRDFK